MSDNVSRAAMFYCCRHGEEKIAAQDAEIARLGGLLLGARALLFELVATWDDVQRAASQDCETFDVQLVIDANQRSYRAEQAVRAALRGEEET